MHSLTLQLTLGHSFANVEAQLVVREQKSITITIVYHGYHCEQEWPAIAVSLRLHR